MCKVQLKNARLRPFALFMALFLMNVSWAFAQLTVTGRVQSKSGEPLIGVNVIEKGTTNGTITDMDGNFVLNVQQGATLVISFVGYKTKEVKVGTAPLDITLEEDSKVLSEVVVTALGIKRERKALGYGVDEVKGEALTKAKETNVINSMAGRVPGLVVSQTAGGPSGSTRVLLRGNTEMTGNNQPLYVIDGVPLDNTNYGSAGTEGGYDLGDGISSINPDDIENMSVLKGPAASALYGSRASHGVILITTKKASGKDGERMSVEYNGTMTFETQLAKWNEVQQIYGMGSDGTYSINAVANTNVQGFISILALAANVICLAVIIKRSIEQKKNPYKEDIWTGTKDYEEAMARADR